MPLNEKIPPPAGNEQRGPTLQRRRGRRRNERAPEDREQRDRAAEDAGDAVPHFLTSDLCPLWL